MQSPEGPLPIVQPGEQVAGYRIEVEIGSGAMAIVYKATDLRSGLQVALKAPRLPAVMVSQGQESLAGIGDRRFLREVRMLVRLVHPHIVALLGAFEHKGRPWLVMELVEGESLRSMFRRGARLAPEVVCRYGAELAGALHFAHGQGVLHRDVSLNNVLISNQGLAKLMDFGLAQLSTGSRRGATASRSGRTLPSAAQPPESGTEARPESKAPPAQSDIARVRKPESPSSRTDTPQEAPLREVPTTYYELVGTAAYMSPEQIRGEAVDGRSDLFSLGTVLYELATGTHAFLGTEPDEILESVLQSEPDPSVWLDDPLSRGLRSIVERAHRKDMSERYPDAGAMEADLRVLIRE